MPIDLVTHLAAHVPLDAREARSLARTRALVAWLASPCDEHADPTHVTGSAVVADGRGRILLHRHKRLGIWLQPGGHVDPGETPWEGAIRETEEETGLLARHPGADPQLVHVDVHEGPRGHVHLDLRYLLVADGNAGFAPAPGESPHLGWFPVEEAAGRGDASCAAAVRAATIRAPRTVGTVTLVG